MKAKVFSLVFVLVLLVGLVPTASADSVSFDIEYMEERPFTVQPGEGWLVHGPYVAQVNGTDKPLEVPSDGKTKFRCNGGPCPDDYVYHYKDTVFSGEWGPGTEVTVVGPVLHDNPDDGRYTQILINGDVVHRCPDGWVAPTCEYTLQEGEVGEVSVKFQDSVAIRGLEFVPVPPPPQQPVCNSWDVQPSEGEIPLDVVGNGSFTDPDAQVERTYVEWGDDGNTDTGLNPVDVAHTYIVSDTFTSQLVLVKIDGDEIRDTACQAEVATNETPPTPEPFFCKELVLKQKEIVEEEGIVILHYCGRSSHPDRTAEWSAKVDGWDGGGPWSGEEVCFEVRLPANGETYRTVFSVRENVEGAPFVTSDECQNHVTTDQPEPEPEGTYSLRGDCEEVAARVTGPADFALDSVKIKEYGGLWQEVLDVPIEVSPSAGETITVTVGYKLETDGAQVKVEGSFNGEAFSKAWEDLQCGSAPPWEIQAEFAGSGPSPITDPNHPDYEIWNKYLVNRKAQPNKLPWQGFGENGHRPVYRLFQASGGDEKIRFLQYQYRWDDWPQGEPVMERVDELGMCPQSALSPNGTQDMWAANVAYCKGTFPTDGSFHVVGTQQGELGWPSHLFVAGPPLDIGLHQTWGGGSYIAYYTDEWDAQMSKYGLNPIEYAKAKDAAYRLTLAMATGRGQDPDAVFRGYWPKSHEEDPDVPFEYRADEYRPAIISSIWLDRANFESGTMLVCAKDGSGRCNLRAQATTWSEETSLGIAMEVAAPAGLRGVYFDVRYEDPVPNLRLLPQEVAARYIFLRHHWDGSHPEYTSENLVPEWWDTPENYNRWLGEEFPKVDLGDGRLSQFGWAFEEAMAEMGVVFADPPATVAAVSFCPGEGDWCE